MDIRSKIIRHHKKGCAALAAAIERTWHHPWAIPTGEIHYLDIMGRNNGTGRRWIEYRCNDIDCPALVAIMEDDFLLQVDWGHE